MAVDQSPRSTPPTYIIPSTIRGLCKIKATQLHRLVPDSSGRSSVIAKPFLARALTVLLISVPLAVALVCHQGPYNRLTVPQEGYTDPLD